MSFCNFNFKSDGRRYDFFFSFNYSSSLPTSESRAKTPLPDSFESCELDEYNLPSLSNLMILLSIKDLVYSAMVNVADDGCWSLTCDYLSLAAKTDVIVNVGQCLNTSI